MTPSSRLNDHHRTGVPGPSELTSMSVGADFMGNVYDKLANVYDFIFGFSLQHGRLRALDRMELKAGTRVLEVGVGTGLNVVLYPRDSAVTGIDFSSSMLEKARRRVAEHGMGNVNLYEMDATDLKFPDNSFDVVYAPYLISVVPEPVRVAQEMYRVCRPGGRIMILNHFMSPSPILSRIERVITPLTVHIGFNCDLDMPKFLQHADLTPTAVEKVNFPRLWTLVTCLKEERTGSSR